MSGVRPDGPRGIGDDLSQSPLFQRQKKAHGETASADDVASGLIKSFDEPSQVTEASKPVSAGPTGIIANLKALIRGVLNRVQDIGLRRELRAKIQNELVHPVKVGIRDSDLFQLKRNMDRFDHVALKKTLREFDAFPTLHAILKGRVSMLSDLSAEDLVRPVNGILKGSQHLFDKALTAEDRERLLRKGRDQQQSLIEKQPEDRTSIEQRVLNVLKGVDGNKTAFSQDQVRELFDIPGVFERDWGETVPIMGLCKEIGEVLRAIGGPGAGADDFLPVLIATFSQANGEQLGSLLAESYEKGMNSDNPDIQGNTEYFLTMALSALSFLKNQ